MGALDAIIDCLPLDTRRKIYEQLQLTAKAQEYRGDEVASFFCRALSGESCPEQKPQPRLTLIQGGAA